MSNFLCDCGCKLFNLFKPFTIEESDFMIWSLKENLKLSKITVPIIECLECNKLHAPRVSFAGKNILDDAVKLYSDLLGYIKKRNDVIDKSILFLKNSAITEKVEYKNASIQAAPANEENPENVINPMSKRNKSREDNKIKIT